MANPANPSVPAPTFTGSHRRSDRDNVRMPGESQALLEFAQNHRGKPQPGLEVFATPRYQITLQTGFPVPGPNGVSFIRCSSDGADDVIREARATLAPAALPGPRALHPGT